MYKNKINHIRLVLAASRRILIVITAIIFSAVPVLLLNQTATAAQITNRSLKIGSGVPGATTTYTFGFKLATASTVQALSFQACTTPLGVCTAPTGLNIEGATAVPTLGGFTGTITSEAQTTASTTTPNYTNAQACNLANMYCLTWADTTSQTAATPVTVTFTNDVVNPTSAGNNTFYVRIYDWAAASLTGTPLDNGNVASATTQTFTVNATIQEQLSFCVGAVSGSAAESVTGTIPSCSTMAGTSLNLGTLGSAYTSISPENVASSNGDNNNGVAELNTNAANGATVSYNAIQQSGTNHQGALRVAGATCAAGGGVYTDQCINSAGYGTGPPVTPVTLTAGTESFGMTIPGVNCSNVTAYTCSATSHNLTVNSDYDCNATDLTTSFSSFDAGGQTSLTTTCAYAWDETGTSETVASSTSVVGGEALLLEFAATPEITTPTGTYTAQANYVATPTF